MSAGQSIPEKGTVDGTGSLVEDNTMHNTSEQDLTNEQVSPSGGRVTRNNPTGKPSPSKRIVLKCKG